MKHTKRKSIRWFRVLLTSITTSFAIAWGVDTFHEPYQPNLAVVRIRTPFSTGSGSIVSCDQMESGFYYAKIYTAAHLFTSKGDTPTITVFWQKGGQEHISGVVTILDKKHDFALVVLNKLTKELPVMRIASTKTLYTDNQKGDSVTAIGCSLGSMPTSKTGLVSWMQNETGRGNPNMIAFNAPAIYGDSGGALINEDGELLGVISQLSVVYGHPYEHQAYAVPVSVIHELLD